MVNSSSFSCGDMVLVPFPFTDPSCTNKRPTVVGLQTTLIAANGKHFSAVKGLTIEVFLP